MICRAKSLLTHEFVEGGFVQGKNAWIVQIDDEGNFRHILVDPETVELVKPAQWRPATEKRPEFAQYLCVVLRPIPGGSYVRELRVLWCDYDNKWGCEDLIVTHWMPLPDFPKEV